MWRKSRLLLSLTEIYLQDPIVNIMYQVRRICSFHYLSIHWIKLYKQRANHNSLLNSRTKTMEGWNYQALFKSGILILTSKPPEWIFNTLYSTLFTNIAETSLDPCRLLLNRSALTLALSLITLKCVSFIAVIQSNTQQLNLAFSF